MAFALGAGAVFGFAPFEWFPLPPISLALLFALWQRELRPGHIALLGLCWGLGCFLGGVSWVYVSMHDVGGMAAPLAALATLTFAAVLALFPALAGYAYGRLRSGAATVRHALLLAGLWALAELLRGWIFTGFPWLALGYSQTPPSPLAGYAPLLGGYGIGLLLALVAAALALAWRRPGPWLLLAALLAGGGLLHGVAWTEPYGPPLTVSLLQGNVPQVLKWDPQQLNLSIDGYVRLARQHPAQLVVLPETAIPLFFEEIPAEVLNDLRGRGDLLLGSAVRIRNGGYLNGAVAVAAGQPPRVYAKHHLVPFGEYIPPGFSWFFELVRIPLADFTAGPAQQQPMEIGGQRVMPNICYEDLFGEEIIRALPEATLLLNLSNTAWFGDSWAQPQHLQISRLRALETGRPMLRATNTGMTAAIGADGQVSAVLPAFAQGALTVTAQGRQGSTPYVRWGNGAVLLLALLAVLLGRGRGPKESAA
ncbi:MAG TPA: apolipoprotein N-acyltransferase [Rhodocyclaceae bacterium]